MASPIRLRRTSCGEVESPEISALPSLSQNERVAFRSYLAEFARHGSEASDDVLMTEEDYAAARLGGAALDFHLQRIDNLESEATLPQSKNLLSRKAKRLRETRERLAAMEEGEQEVRGLGAIRSIEDEMLESMNTSLVEHAAGVMGRSMQPATPDGMEAAVLKHPRQLNLQVTDRPDSGKAPANADQDSVLDLMGSDTENAAPAKGKPTCSSFQVWRPGACNRPHGV